MALPHVNEELDPISEAVIGIFFRRDDERRCDLHTPPQPSITASGSTVEYKLPPEDMTERGQASRVLVVDDNRQMRNLVARTLRMKGFDTHVVGSAEDALAVTATSRPDLVITDLEMPGLGGFALLSELRRALPGTPVVVLSGIVDDRHAQRAGELGATAVLPKPFVLEDLVREVERALKG